MRFFALVPALALLAACGTDDALTGPGPDLGIAPSADADAGSSYRNSNADVWISYAFLPRPAAQPPRLGDAIAYLDANGSGRTDVFLATGEFQSQDEVGAELFINTGGGNFVYDVTPFAGSPPPATHARKALAADFDGDGRDDVFVLDHGFDAPPFPGSMPKLVLQTAPGTFSWSRLPHTGFHHGGAAGDVDNDGDIDVFVGGFSPFFYVNDGSATFTRESRFLGNIAKVFSAELIDVDRDGFLDLLVGAHERDGDATAVYWGGAAGTYVDSRRTLIPASPPYGAVLDFDAEDVDGDGDRDLVLNRTRDGDDGDGQGFYVGRRVQLVLHDGNRGLTPATGRIDDAGTARDPWLPWLRLRDIDGDDDLDIVPDDAGFNFRYLNDGTGSFTRIEVVTEGRQP